MKEILDIGEKVHIIERRYFENDPRRHIVGKIVRVINNSIRIIGCVWVFDSSKNQFVKRSELRERILVLGERVIVNVIPQEVDLNEVKYIQDMQKGLTVTDGKDFRLEINEFSSVR